jgi:two-component system, cell cycle sensor histidine kinase and response regulator CckA
MQGRAMSDAAPSAPTILVVDDHPDIRSTTALLLQTFGFGVWEAGTGRDALRRAQDRPDLVILDVGLPDLDGREVCRALKADPDTAPTPVLMLSGLAVSDYDRAGGLDGGADAYLTKPVDPLVLVAQARALVRAHQALLRAQRAEAAARAGERRFRALVEKSYDAIDLIAADGTILYASPSVVNCGGRTPDEVVGRNAFDWSHPDEVAATRAAFTALVRQPGASITGESRYRHKDGTWRWVEGTCTNLLADPDVGTVVANFHDVTDRRQLEERLRQAAKMEAVGRLAGGVAHDFNNLLTVISGFGELALAGLPTDHPVREMVAEMVRAGGRAAGVTRGLLAFSRKQVLAPEVLHLSDVVRGLEPLLRQLLGADVRLATDLQPGLGRVKADRGQLEQVVMNLCVNARDAMPRGGDLHIETRDIPAGPAGRHGPHVLLSVSDSGDGMTEEVRARLFEPFFTTKGVGQGTGLGLATVHGIVEQSGGHIEVESELGRGTTFRVSLPRAADLPAQAKPAAPLPTDGGRETVLLVEDEPGVRRLVRRVLQAHGYAVLEAGDGEQAEAVARAHPGSIDLLITDVVMPGRSGREVAEALRGAWPGLKVLFMSGYTDDEVMRRGIETDRVHFLQKPFAPAALAAKVRQVLDEGHGPTG